MNGKIYSTRGLTKVYGKGRSAVHALRGVDPEIPQGEIVVLLGPSSSGKSTFSNILGGLDRSTDGVAFFQDQNLTGMSGTQLTRCRRDHVGFVFQFYNLMPNLTAYENVELVTEIAGNPMDPAKPLALVGLRERVDHFAELMGRIKGRYAGLSPKERERIILMEITQEALHSFSIEGVKLDTHEIEASVVASLSARNRAGVSRRSDAFMV